MAPSDSEADARLLAERLDVLFKTVPQDGSPGQLHTAASVAEALNAQGIEVTATHIRALRSGRRSNPSFRLLVGLAELFHVPIDYFVDDEASKEIQESLQALMAIRGTAVQQIMMRAHGVSPQSLDSVLNLLDQIRRIEGLDSDSPGSQVQ